MAEPLDLGALMAMIEAGDDSLIAEDELALLPPMLERPERWFGENLAEVLPDRDISAMAHKVSDGWEADDASRAPWLKWEKTGLRLLGISEKDPIDPPFENASRAVHPGLIDAVIQFQARAMSELWPPDGPAKAIAEGSGLNPALEQQAERVSKYLNWLYTTRMPSGYTQHDKLLFRLPLSGSGFKKVYYCPLAGCVVSRFVPPEDIVVPYGASDLETSPRVSHVLAYSGSDINRLIEAGVFRDVSLGRMTTDEDKTDLQHDLDAITGISKDTAQIADHERYVLIEQSVYADIDGEPPNSPYLVTIEKDSETVFSIYRDWREDDPRRQRRQRYTHYYFFPGLDGFYGMGFSHVLGRMAESMSGNLRALLDSGMLANLQGGFRSSDVRFPKGNRSDGISLSPGAWLPIDATAEDIGKMFFTVPYKEPSATLFSLLQYMDELFRRVSGTTSELVGDNKRDIPVGTVLARIEQGLKVQTQIQIRCHQAQSNELALVCQAIADNLPDAQYCNDVLDGVPPEQFAADFDGRIDVRPVSDPNAVTSTQRMVIAQALVERAAQAPDLYNREEVERRLLETMRVQDIDALIASKQQPERMGPVEENMALTMMRPVRSFPDQDHTAHLVVHRQWLETLEQDKDAKKRVEPAAIAHIAEHMAWAYFMQMQQAMGVSLPAAPMGAGQPMDPQQENMLAMMSAQAVQLMAQQPKPVDPSAVADAKAEAEIRRKDALASAQIERDNTQMIARLNRDVAAQEARLAAQFVSDQSKDALGAMP